MKRHLTFAAVAICGIACGFAEEPDPQLHLGDGCLRLVAPGGRVAWERPAEGTPTDGFVSGDCVYWRRGDVWSRIGVFGGKAESVTAEEAGKLQKKSGAKRLPDPRPGVVAVRVPAWRWSLPFYTVTAEDEAKFRELARTAGLARPAKPRRVLIVARALGYAHNEALSWGNRAFCVAGEETRAFAADVTNDVAVLANRSVLDRYDAVVLNNCTFVTAKANPGLADALCGYVRDGGGLCLVHSSVDSFYDAPEVQAMTGGRFCGHPWMAGGTWSFRNERPDSPLMTPFRGLGPTFRRSEEIYVQASPPFDRKTCEVLISMDLSDPTTKKSENAWGKEKKPLRTDGDYAVSWTKNYGRGRIFYTSFGHDKRAFFDPARFGHMLLGLQYCVGDCLRVEPVLAIPKPGAVLPAACAVTDGDFSLSVLADLSSVTNAETLYEAPGSFTLAVREAGAEPGLADYDRKLGNYLNCRLPDGRCPVIEAVVTGARRSIHPYYEKEFYGCRVGIPLALVKGGLGSVPIRISCAKTAWRIRIGDVEDEDFLVAPMKPPVESDANVRSDRVKSAVFGPADDRAEPVSRPVSDPIQYWTAGGFNTWVGDVVVANWRDRFHVFYLKDRRHHCGKGGSGGHYFAHVSTPDLVHWDAHPTVTPIKDHWFTCGTGTPFEFGGKLCIAYGVHSTRFVPRARTTEPRMLEELSRTGVMPSYRFAGTDLVPLGSTWAESTDGFVFRPSGIVFHTTQNPAINVLSDGSLRLTTGFFEDTGVGGFWGSAGMTGWTKLPGEPPLKGDCPCPFEWNGRNYLLQGFRGYARQKEDDEWETLRGSDIYDGLNVPMVAPWKGDRRLLVGWVRHFYGWGGWLCFRELVRRPDGSLGTKWVPEIVPPSPIREFRLRAGEPFRLRFSGSAGAPVELSVNPQDGEAAFADVRPDGTLEAPGDPPIGHSFRVTGICGLDRDYAVRLVVHYDRKADATLLDAEIAGDRTIVCRRPGMYSLHDAERAPAASTDSL